MPTPQPPSRSISPNATAGRRRLFLAYEKRTGSTITHPLLDYKVSCQRAFELQFRPRARTLTGEIERFLPFTTRWPAPWGSISSSPTASATSCDDASGGDPLSSKDTLPPAARLSARRPAGGAAKPNAMLPFVLGRRALTRPLPLLLAALTTLLPAAVRAADTTRPGARPTALDRHVAAPDPAYQWRRLSSTPGPGHVAHTLEFVSQRWLTPAEVSRPEWQHTLHVVVPNGRPPATALLFLGGGSQRPDSPPSRPSRDLLALATATGSVVAELRHIPNQPLMFHQDGRARTEDDLIAYSWAQYLKTGDERWPARLPMTKAAVRALDTVTAFLATPEGGGLAVDRFVVAGASKRGWTAWTTALVDRRVVGLCPLVIDVLNVEASMEHHHRAYGFFAPAVGDYVRHGIMHWSGTPESRALYALEDPFSYRDRATFPKLLINACGDQFFLPDSSRFYFDELPGPKYLRYIPNTDHSLKNSDASATLAAWHHALIHRKPLPEFTWRHAADGTITVAARTAPRQAVLWQATNPTARDFRLETLGPAWKSSPFEIHDGVGATRIVPPAAGWTAYLLEFTFDLGGPAPLKLTTNVTVIPDTLPHGPPDLPKPKGYLTQ